MARFLLIALATFLAGCQPVSAMKPVGPPPLPLDDWSIFQTADASGEALCARDEAPGPAFHAWHRGDRLPKTEQGAYACFRFRVPKGDWAEPSLFIEGVENDLEFFLFGEKRYSLGSMIDHGRRTHGYPWMLIPLPRDAAGHWASLWIRSHVITIGPYRQVSIGSHSEQVLRMLREEAPTMATGAFCAALGLIALWAFFWRRSERYYLWLGIFGLASALTDLTASSSPQLFIDAPAAIEYLRIFARCLLPCALSGFAFEIFERRLRALGWVSAMTGLFGAGVLLTTVIDYRLYEQGGWRLLLVCILFANAAVLMGALHQALDRRWDGVLLTAGMAGLYVAEYHDRLVIQATGIGMTLYPFGQLALMGALGTLALGRFAAVFSEQEQTSARLREQNAQLEKIERDLTEALAARESFLSVASHELRTPLTALMLQVQRAMRAGESGPVGREALEPIARSTERMAQLTRQLLDVTRIHAGRLSLERSPLELGALVSDVAARMSVEAERAGCELKLRVEPVRGGWDRGRLDQVLSNLLTNAFKYGAGKPVELDLRLEGGEAHLSVTDHGIGIAPEDRQRIFGRFERAVEANHYAGLGLGLWIVREIVQAHGGRIDVESTPGQGSRFTVVLPGAESVATAKSA